MKSAFLDVIVTPWERFTYDYGWMIPVVLVVIVAVIVAVIVRKRKKK